MGIAVALPYFSALLSFFGGFVFAPTTYFVSPQEIKKKYFAIRVMMIQKS